MKQFFTVFIFLFLTSFTKAQYIPESPYIQEPSLAIGYVDSCARFWLPAYDNNRGGFYTNINRFGQLLSSWGTNKNMISQSRNVYGLVRGYMLTGDTSYIKLAGKALNWMYEHTWDNTNGGWYQDIDENGNVQNPFSNKSAFNAHYALLGIMAYYEATRDTTAWNWLIKGYHYLEENFWDERELYRGYFDNVTYNNISGNNKSFNATVDAVTTHLLYLYLFTKEEKYKDRLIELALQMKERFAASMPHQAIGFVEHFDSEWNWNNQETMTIMGHVLKTAWCLTRIHQLFPDTSFISTAEMLVNNVWEKGYDHVYGGPYKDFNRITGQMLLWGLQDSAKAWWQMEQAVVAGLQLYDVTKKSVYLQMADETLNFFMKYFVDHQYGEVFADRTRRGGIAWNEAKGNSGKAGYHSTELGYYTYLYSSFFYADKPVTLNYLINPVDYSREILLTPFALPDYRINISSVELEGESYTSYNPAELKLLVDAGKGGNFKVTFSPVITGIKGEEQIISDYQLDQNYPNPFNPVTRITYYVPERSNIKLIVYDVLGTQITELVNGITEPGKHTISFDASSLSSGVYFYRIVVNGINYNETRKMVLIK